MKENTSMLKQGEHTISSQQKAAKVAGFASLVTTAIIVVSNFTITTSLHVDNNAVETAKNILAHESLFRVGIICNLMYCAGIIVLCTSLYIVLKPVNQGLALIAAFWRLLYALVWVFVAINSFLALRLLTGAEYLHVFETDRLEALAKIFLSGMDSYYVGLLFWALASTVCCWLWLKSNYIPKMLAAFGLISSAWCVICTISYIIFPGFANTVNLWWFDTAMLIFELVLSFWLLFKGLRLSGIPQSN